MKKLDNYILEKFKIKKKDYNINDDTYYKSTLNILNNYLDYTFTINEVKQYIEEKTSILCKAVANIYDWVEKNSITNIKAFTSQAILDKSQNTMRKNFITDESIFSSYVYDIIIRKEDKYLIYDSKTSAGIRIFIKDDVLIYQDYNKSQKYSYTYAFVKDE